MGYLTGLSIKQIRKNNSQEFFDDIETARQINVRAYRTNVILKVKKSEVYKWAEISKIYYEVSDDIMIIN